MIKLIVGLKGSGKTKTLIEKVNAATEASKGSVICLEKGDKLRYDIKYQARLIDVEEYNIDNAHGLRCFVAGLHASNSDITHIFIDSALKICKDDAADLEVGQGGSMPTEQQTLTPEEYEAYSFEQVKSAFPDIPYVYAYDHGVTNPTGLFLPI